MSLGRARRTRRGDLEGGGPGAARPGARRAPRGTLAPRAVHYPQPFTPAMRSVFLPAVNRACRMAIEEIGAPIETLELAEIGGWVCQRTVPLDPQDVAGRVERSVRAVREDLGAQWIGRWQGEWKPPLAGEIARLAAVPLGDLADAGLLAHLAQARALLDTGVDWHMKLNTAIQFWIAEYALLAIDLLAWDDLTLLRVFGGLSEMSSAPAKAIAEIARFVRTRRDLLADLEAGASSDHMAARCPQFRAWLTDYQSRFGLRIIPYDVAFPTIGEAGDITLRLLRDHCAAAPIPRASPLGWTPAEAPCWTRRTGLWAKGTTRRGRDSSGRPGVPNGRTASERDTGCTIGTCPSDFCAEACWKRDGGCATGDGSAARKKSSLDDVFYLEFREISDALESGGALEDLVRRRRGERLWVLSRPGPESFGEAPPPAFPASPPPEAVGTLRALLWVQGERSRPIPTVGPRRRAQASRASRPLRGSTRGLLASCGRSRNSARSGPATCSSVRTPRPRGPWSSRASAPSSRMLGGASPTPRSSRGNTVFRRWSRRATRPLFRTTERRRDRRGRWGARRGAHRTQR